MLTSRGWWLFMLATLMTFVGTWLSDRFGSAIAMIGGTVLVWLLIEWALFSYQAFFLLPKLRISREIRDDRKAVPLLWANTEFDVRVLVRLPQGQIPDVYLEDCVPFVVSKLEDLEQSFTSISAQNPGVIEYRIKCLAPGELIFEGVRVRLTDRQGFFSKTVLLKEGSHYAVLPRLSGAEGSRRSTKRHNIFPPPGSHRLRQPGGGTELHDLRDYMPGDPPKMIAWKPSARKDKLITKEFESEVPIRATLFVDASESVRVGPIAKSKLTRLANLAAGVAEGIAIDRDHVGLFVFDEYGTQMMRPNRSRTHLIDMLHLLAKAAARPTPLGPFADANALSKLAFPVANELYPELMDLSVNTLTQAAGFRISKLQFLYTLPKSLFWNPISDTRRFWLMLLCLTPAMFLVLGFIISATALANGYPWFAITYLNILLPVFRAFGWGGFVVLSWIYGISVGITGLFWFIHGITGFFGERAVRRKQRKQLGLLYATLDSDEPGAEVHYLFDDQIFARRTMKFLADHQTRYPVRLYDIRGRYLFYSRPKLAMLASALNYGVSRGRDNELFVLLADLVDLAEELGPVIEATRVAIARHHQVIVILPWQEDIPLPPNEPPDEYSLKIARSELIKDRGLSVLDRELERDQIERYHKNFFLVRKEFGRLGVTVVRAGHEETVQMILNRMNRLRGMGVRR